MLLTRRASRAAELAAEPENETVPTPVAGRPARAWRKDRPLVGGILLIVGGLAMFGSSQLDFGRLHIHLGIEGLQAVVIPLLLIVLGALVVATPAHRILYGVIALATSVYSIVGVNLGGFLIGFVLSAVGGILAVSWMPRAARTAESEPTAEADAEEAIVPDEAVTR
ncbi:hypothetical protein GCM10023065_28230 [Microbacterium laevaniformans]|uniref:DUF6114 domain-containing protein n=1 Tax=Microbacterium laevaniformans TaxID=36807 RepID=UPI001956A944|nr:DUF6114 domain-containing protein [Microbacterium laevaniformans]MBM7753785.1 hypothetical protein [Microbacterium laevaniformans]GLJ64340.1 hypothetical protein GCM10017578_12280 [Microbacterium laevaniformans]